MPRAVPLVMAVLAAPLLQAQAAITLLLVNGKIITGDPQQKEAQAVAIAGGRIDALGSTAEILRLREPNTQVFDCHNHLVLPGFHDGRVHFYQGGRDLTGPRLRYTQNAAEFRGILRDFASHVPNGHWIVGGNWDCRNWKKDRLPTQKLIDSATEKHPALLKSADGTMWLANKLALRLAGIGRSTPNPPGGVIVRDAKGNPTGLLKGAAVKLVERLIPPPSEMQIVAALEEAEAYANARGVTSIRDVSCTSRVRQAYLYLLHAGRLTVRVTCEPEAPPTSGSDWDNGPMNVMSYAFSGDIEGSLAPGKPADLTVLSQGGAQVIATIFNGVPVYGGLWPLRDKSGLILRGGTTPARSPDPQSARESAPK
ncbi:MAG TPA: amidohydrolase family protein [Bryobacteraceae bacterium]